MFCPKCGTQNADTSKFCCSCGALLMQPSEELLVSGYSTVARAAGEEDLIREIIGKNADYYIQKSSKLTAAGSKISWNWAAFFFSMYWMIYRKMYLLGFALLAAYEVSYWYIGGAVYLILNLAIPIFSGIMGNFFYTQYVNNCCASAAAMAPTSRAAYVAKNGGTNMLLAIGTCVLVGLIPVALLML